MPKIVDLKENQRLLDTNFSGYKLSLDTVPVIPLVLAREPYIAKASPDEYSLLHAELYSMQNLLYVDPWERSCTYFVNEFGEVVASKYNESVGRPEPLKALFKISGRGDSQNSNGFNYSIRFISEQYCVVIDGQNTMYLLDTGDRYKQSCWKEVSHAKCSNGAIRHSEADDNFILYDCRLDTCHGKKTISLALGQVTRNQTEEQPHGEGRHYMRIHWALWVSKDAGWDLTTLDILEGYGSVYYCAFEPKSEALIISSNTKYKFASKIETEAEKGTIYSNMHWSQSLKEINIKIHSCEGMEESLISVSQTKRSLIVKYKNEMLLNCEFRRDLDVLQPKWKMESGCMHITLTKKSSSIWHSRDFIEKRTEFTLMDDDANNALAEGKDAIVNLNAPMEDCDFPLGDDEVTIDRYHLHSKSVTHSIILGSTPPLFYTTLRPGFPAAIAIRQDVDCTLWLQKYSQSSTEDWSLCHEGTLPAFGYVQASKQQKKFLACSPDLSYSVVCESNRHVFLYKAKHDNAAGLRNRFGSPQSSVGKQQLITLETDDEILGIATNENLLTLLTKKQMLYLQVNS